MYESYAFLRPIVIFAGAIGIFQSLAWISLAIVGLVAHYCNLDFDGMVASYGTITELTLFRLYFHGSCFQPGLPGVEFEIINNLNLMTPGAVHAWMWVYLFVSIFWAISSITMITVVTHRFIKIANIFLYIWIFITVALSLMDLAFGILFALDYNDLMHLAHQTPTTDVAGQFVLISAQTASGAMMTIAFRGFVLWILNVALALYLFAQTFNIFDYNKFQPAEPIGTTNRAFVNDDQSHPINAYGNKNQPNLWLAPTVAVDQRQRDGSALYEERKRHYDNQPIPPHSRPTAASFYPPPRSRDDDIVLRRDNNNARLVRELSHRNTRPAGRDEPNVPVPDYSPQMPRSNPYEASPLRPTQKQPSRY